MRNPDPTGCEHFVPAMPAPTVVLLVRHGQTPTTGARLPGRAPGLHLAEEGRRQAEAVARRLAGLRRLAAVYASPLERAQETLAPLAERLAITPQVDARVIESGNKFQGVNFGAGARTFLRRPDLLRHMYNPFRPSWGEPYDEIAGRMVAAVHDARDAAAGHEAVVVSHQLPIWTTRLFLEGRSYLHHPKSRQCTLCSLTSIVFDDDRVTQVRYSEPAGDLIPVADRSAPFSAGGAPREDRP